MKVTKIFGLLVLVMTFVLAHQALAEANYESCANLNDYLSYSKCVAEVDSKNNGVATTTAVVPQDLKAQDGEYSLIVSDGGEQTNSRYVALSLTASTSTTKIAIAKDSNFGFSVRQNFADKVWWLLEDTPNETQYVYVKFLNSAGNSLGVVGVAIKYAPREVDKVKEAWATSNFLKIFKRKIDLKKPTDSAWLEIASYGLMLGAPKDEAKEKIALAKFVSIFKRVPAGDDWTLVHAIAYSQDLANVATAKPVASPSTVAVVTQTTNGKTCKAKQLFKTVMDVGSKGNEVKALQEFLQCLGYLDSGAKITSTFDSVTEEAVKKFQEQYELKCSTGVACGRVGPGTAKKLNTVVSEAKTDISSTPAEAVAEIVTGVALKLKTNLTVGSAGAEVTALQKYLAQDKELYPEGKVTGTFGPLTEAAVKRFQTKHDLMCKDGTACGYVGSATRQKLEEVSAQ